MFSRKKMNIAILVLVMAGCQVNAENTYVAQAKQKASDVRDWSAQAAGKVREKASDAYAVSCQKARALYEKAKEHKKLVAGAAAYLLYEAVGCYNGWRTPFYRLAFLPGKLDADIANRDNQIGNLHGRVNNAHVIIANRDNQIANLNRRVLNANGDIANRDNVVIPDLNNQIRDLNGRLQTVRDTHQQELQRRNQELNVFYNNELRNRIQRLTNEHNLEMHNLREQHQQALTDAQNQLGMPNNRIDELQRDHVTALRDLEAQHQQNINRLTVVHQQLQQALRDEQEWTQQLQNTNNNLDGQIRQLVQDNNARIDELNNAHNLEMRNLRAQHQQALTDAQNQHDMTNVHMDQLRRDHATALQNLITQHQQNIDRLTLAHQQAQQQLHVQHQQQEAQINQLHQDNEARIQIQEKNLRLALDQGKAQADLNHKHTAIGRVLDSLTEELLSNQNQVVDSVGIVTDLMTQARELVHCRELVRVAYPNQQDKMSEVGATFNRLVTLTQQTIDHVVNKINTEAEWLVQDTQAMSFNNITADNFDDSLEHVNSDLANYFGQLNTAFEQLNFLVESSKTNKSIQSCLATCDSDSIVQSLGAMLVNSFEKIQNIGLHQDDNTIVVKSYDDAFNLYVHSLVANSAYHSYNTCCAMMPDSEESLVWSKSFEAGLSAIHACIYNGAVRVQEPMNNVGSTIGNSFFMSHMNNSMLGVSGFNLDQSTIDNVNLDDFFKSSIQPDVKRNELMQSVMGRSRLGNSSFFVSSSVNEKSVLGSSSVIDIDDLLEHCVNKDDQDWQAELNVMAQSAIDLTNSFVQSSLSLSNMQKSVNQEEKVNVSSSVVDFNKSELGESCPFVVSAIWGQQNEQLAQSGRFDNRQGYSRVVRGMPIYFNSNLGSSTIDSGSAIGQNNNNSPKPLGNSSTVNDLSWLTRGTCNPEDFSFGLDGNDPDKK